MYNLVIGFNKEKKMASTNIKLNFKNEQEGNIMRLVGLLTIFFSFVPPLIAYFALADSLSTESKEVVAELTNFNIVGFVAMTICSIIPLLGWLVFPLVYLFFLIMNIIFAVQIVNGTEVKIPIIFQIIKINN